MGTSDLFCYLSSEKIAEFIRTAEDAVCYVGPGIQLKPAEAIVDAAERIGRKSVAVSLDVDERVMRMGYGDIAAIHLMREAGIEIDNSHGLRNALLIVDNHGYIFTPVALYLEAESSSESARNALRLSPDQVAEAMARLSPKAKAMAIERAQDPEEKARIAGLPVEVGGTILTDAQFEEVDANLELAPPVKFDLARQVRVFEPYLQYVELSLIGAAIQKNRLVIPGRIQKLGGSEDLEGRLRTTFGLIEKGAKLSSKSLEADLNEIRKNFTPSLRGDHGRVVLKAAKPTLLKRLDVFRKKLEEHRSLVGEGLQKHLDDSRRAIIEYYVPRVMDAPPDSLLGQSLGETPTEVGARQWLNAELDRVFPDAESLIKEMRLDAKFKDVTYETLNREDFLQSVKEAFPGIDWDKAYAEFRAAGEEA